MCDDGAGSGGDMKTGSWVKEGQEPLAAEKLKKFILRRSTKEEPALLTSWF